MAKNIRLISNQVDISAIAAEVNKYADDWGVQKTYNHAGQLHELPVSVLQLVIGMVEKEGDHPSNSEMSVKTPLYDKYAVTKEWLEKNAPNHDRVAFLKIAVGAGVGTHIDEGTYYLTRDRYHLAIQGEYHYTVNGQKVHIKPGTWFWFDNKTPHSMQNVGDVPRITMVFDIPHSSNNP